METKIPPKPKVPEDVYTDGIWEYTITDYHYCAPGNPLFIPGWWPIKKLNPEHPKMKAFIQKAHEAQEAIMQRESYRYPYVSRGA